MTRTTTIRTITLAAVAAGALAVFGQAASAEASAPSVSEIVVTKSTDLPAGDLLIERWQSSGVAADAGRLDSANNLKQLNMGVHDADGDVDGRDFLIWQRNVGASGDFDNDGDVDGRDFLVWQRSGAPAAGTVHNHAEKNQDIEVESDAAATRYGLGNHEVGHWMGVY
jgi:hypothetical protein